jgi:hypothetical protein
MEVGKAIAPPRRIGRLGSLRGGPRSACCAAGKHCNGSLQVNSRRTGLLSKSPAGSRLSILRTRRCGCHARRYIEAFSFRLVAPLKKSSLAIFAASAASAVLAMPSMAVWAKGSRMQYRLANGRQSSTGTLGRRSVEGARGTFVATLVERRSRFLILVKLPEKRTEVVVAARIKAVRKLSAALRKSLTWDRGSELSAHSKFTVATDVKVYFCDPYSPWQRGSNETTNGLLRQYYPKGTDLSEVTQRQLECIGAPGGIRTHDLQLRRLPLYPAELRAHVTGTAKFTAMGSRNAPFAS